MSRAATHAEPLKKESRSKEDEMIIWSEMVPLSQLGYAAFVLRLPLPRNVSSHLSS